MKAGVPITPWVKVRAGSSRAMARPKSQTKGVHRPSGAALQQDVGGLQVPVDEVQAVGDVDGLGHLGQDGDRSPGPTGPRRPAPGSGPRTSCMAIRRRRSVVVHVVDPADVGVDDAGWIWASCMNRIRAAGSMSFGAPSGPPCGTAPRPRPPAPRPCRPGPGAVRARSAPPGALRVEPRGLELEGFRSHSSDPGSEKGLHDEETQSHDSKKTRPEGPHFHLYC